MDRRLREGIALKAAIVVGYTATTLKSLDQPAPAISQQRSPYVTSAHLTLP